MRLNVRIKGVIAKYVDALIEQEGLYDNQSEYVRDLIRRDMIDYNSEKTLRSVLQVYKDKDLGVARYREFTSILSILTFLHIEDEKIESWWNNTDYSDSFSVIPWDKLSDDAKYELRKIYYEDEIS